MYINKNFGFTMAEILIAMTILGVVALLTIPQILGNTGGRSNKLMIQKSYAVLSQNLKMAYPKLGYDTSDVTTTIASGTNKSIEEILTKTMDLEKLDTTTHPFTGSKLWELDLENGILEITKKSGPIAITNETTASKKYKNGAIFKSRDGVYYIFPGKSDINTTSCTKDSPCLVYIDVNGENAPNTVMECEKIKDNENKYKENTAIWNHKAKQFQIRKAKTNDDGTPAVDDTTGKQLYDDPAAAACTFDAMNTADIYAVLIYGGTVVPATNVDELVLNDRQ